MRKTMILTAFIMMLSFSSAHADIAPLPERLPDRPVTQPPAKNPDSPLPVNDRDSPKEEQKQGICFSPTVVAGLFFSLSLIAFGLRAWRRPEFQPETAEAAS